MQTHAYAGNPVQIRAPFHHEGTGICFLLARHSLTNKEISELTGVGPNIVKAIDKRRLEGLYVVDGKLRRPETYARFLGIDEFKLHNGHKYATHIIDMKCRTSKRLRST